MFRRVQFVPRLGGIPSEDVLASDLDGPFAPGNRVAKRATDLAGATVIALLASPLLLALWAWVRLDSRGGAFHRPARIPQGGTTFHCLKFRSIHVDAVDRLRDVLDRDPALRREYQRWHKLRGDARVTRAGRFLRRTSLDELPQLWNLLRGRRSLVGPRPYLAREAPEMGAHAAIILQAKPGITGYWQVSGRNDVTFDDRLRMEAHFVRNWSVWWDVILLIQTPEAVLPGPGDAR